MGGLFSSNPFVTERPLPLQLSDHSDEVIYQESMDGGEQKAEAMEVDGNDKNRNPSLTITINKDTRKSTSSTHSTDKSIPESTASSSDKGSFDEYEGDGKEEDEEDYKKGGYHRVLIGDVFKGKYKVVKKLGWGHFSTVWLVVNSETSVSSALKIVKSARHYTEAAEDEVRLLQAVAKHDPNDSKCVVRLYDSFSHTGPHGKHICMNFEVLGSNLLDLIKLFNYRGIPLPLVKIICKQVLIGLDYLHTQCGIIHTDLKPENVLLDHRLPHPDAEPRWEERYFEKQEPGTEDRSVPRVVSFLRRKLTTYPKSKIADLGNACWIKKHFTDDIQTRQYRAPEVILERSWGPPVDMWSMACMVFELATGDLLFEPKKGKDYDKSEDHLALMMELLGRFSKSFLGECKNARKYFTRENELRHISKLKPWGLVEVLMEKYKFPEDEAQNMASFIVPMLEYLPSQRATAKQSLSHPWIKDVPPFLEK